MFAERCSEYSNPLTGKCRRHDPSRSQEIIAITCLPFYRLALEALLGLEHLLELGFKIALVDYRLWLVVGGVGGSKHLYPSPPRTSCG